MALHIQAASGGGWGKPFERDPQSVLRDVRDGVVSIESAERDYGVAINAKAWRVDEAKTQGLRGK